MTARKHSFLGIEINASEIHIAEVRGQWPDVQIMRVYHAPTPPGVVEGGRILDPAGLGDCLRGLLRVMGAGTRDAVLGLPTRALMTRSLDFPTLPAGEMRAIIAGELAHYHTLGEADDAFDFTLLHAPSKSVENGQTFLVMASEAHVAAGYVETAQRAGLRLLALEPLPIALLRALWPHLQKSPDALCVLIQHGDVEIAVVEEGRLRLYRRLDIAGNDLIGSEGIHAAGLNSLAMELQRSLEYYVREFSPDRPITSVLLVTPHPELAGLPAPLADALGLPVRAAELRNDTPRSRIEAFDLRPPLHCARAGAVGLAMRSLPALPSALPSMNLNRGVSRSSRKPRPSVSNDMLHRRMALALASSAALAVCGVALTLRAGGRVSRLRDAVAHLQTNIQMMQQDKQTRLDALQAHDNLLLALAQEGYAFPRYMDTIAAAVGPQAGLLEVSLNRSGQFTIIGEATEGKAVIAALEGIKRSPYLESASLNSFDSAQNQTAGHLIRFQITAQLVMSKP